MNILINNKLYKVTVKEEMSSMFEDIKVFRISHPSIGFAAVLEDGTSAVLLGDLYNELSSNEKSFIFLHEVGHIRAGHHKLAAYGKYEWDIEHEYIADLFAAKYLKGRTLRVFNMTMEAILNIDNRFMLEDIADRRYNLSAKGY